MGFRRNTVKSWVCDLVLAQPLASCVALCESQTFSGQNLI